MIRKQRTYIDITKDYIFKTRFDEKLKLVLSQSVAYLVRISTEFDPLFLDLLV